MRTFHRQYLVFLCTLFVAMPISHTSYIRHLSASHDINHLTYYSALKWLYVASIDSLSIYDDQFTLLQTISITNSNRNDLDICKINPCQCLNNLMHNHEDLTADRNRRSKPTQAALDQNNYNSILYLETETTIESQPYLIDCWSLQPGSCIVRNALNLSDVYSPPVSDRDRYQAQKLLFNTDSTAPNHLFPFHLKLNKCNSTPTYLFLTSTLRKNFVPSNSREKLDNLTDHFYHQCLEQAQRRTIALRAFVHDVEIKSTKATAKKFSIPVPTSQNITGVNATRAKRQVANVGNSISRPRSSSTGNKSNLTTSTSLPQSSWSISTISDPFVTNTNATSSSMNSIHEQGSFLNINDYCPEQFSVVRSIYTDFFERESFDKFRVFQDVIYDEHDSATYVFTNQQHVSKIVRLCEGQISFRHYVEVQILCGHEYTLIQKVKLIRLGNNQRYLLAIASKPKTLNSLEPSVNSHSAICLYDLDQIRNAFINNILDLARGNVSLGMAWLHGESVIPQYPTPYGNLARCSTTRDASYLMIYEGSSSIIAEPLIVFPTDQLTSLQATLVHDYIVAFVGTADGKIKKISVHSTTKNAFQFEETFVHYGESILRDLILDEQGRFLYGATKTRLFQVDLHDCDRHKTCFECLSTQNPYCGWGTTVNRCTVRTNETEDGRRFSWLQIRDNCPAIVRITPNAISKAKSSKLHLKVDSVPDDPTSTYACSFSVSSPLIDAAENESNNRSIFFSNATKTDNDIQCNSPPAEVISTIDHESIVIRLLYNTIVLTEKSVTFYDCSSYLTCTACLNNSFDCTWHVLAARCLDRDLSLQTNQTAENGSLIDRHHHQCPRYNISAREIFIADGDAFVLGERDRVRIRTMGLRSSIQKYFRCVLTWTNHSTVMAVGKLRNDLLVCEAFQISYEKDTGQQNLTLEIEWKECDNGCAYKKLEALSNTTVNIYKCKYLAESCGSCLLLHDDYHCIWCQTDKSCRNQANSSNCKPNHVISASMGICPDPRLRQIHPLVGPQFGRTPIQIYGSNLGKKAHDASVVLISANHTEYPCQIQLDSYIVAQSFICQTPSLSIGAYSIKVSVHSVVSRDRPVFHVVKPTIRIVQPTWGPRSGGTLLSIHGKHLTIGSQIRVFVGDQECFLIAAEETLVTSTVPDDENSLVTSTTVSPSVPTVEDEEQNIQCRTSKLGANDEHEEYRAQRFVKRQALWIGSVRIFIDNFTETYANVTYSYTEDPQVYNLSRYSGIQSGGLPFLVRGTNFDSIQTPQFFIEYNRSRVLVENCSVKSPGTMLCFGPSLTWMSNDSTPSTLAWLPPTASTVTSTTSAMVTHVLHARSSGDHRCLEFKFGFYMDNVEHVRNTSTFHETFQFCPDPDIYPFNNDGKRIQYRYDYLTIEGSNLLDVATINDYSITIGSYPCNITSISDKQIVCQPTNGTIEKLIRKKRISLDIHSNDKEEAIVRVILGRRIYTLGTLTYTFNAEKRSLILYYVVASISGFLLTVFVIIVSIVFRRINTKRTRQVHRLQNQIDTLEMRVARECKEAFAELQTDIGEMTNDLTFSGVPYHDYRTFCMKVVFPNASDEEKYMMLHNIDIPLEANRRNHVRQGLQLLSQSLYNRHFLLLIIRTLESDKMNFRLQDRMQFASLISILLQDNIEYFTEILKILLRELIEKSLQQDRSNSKILLRSNASVAEKMLSNWFAFLLFGYIKERLGSPLYILFQSIKQQIQKGPIDSMTSESRYSLSEDKLLRQHIDYLSMIVYVIQKEDNSRCQPTSTPVPIKVLSCDSITQVKEKIVDHFYKTIPFSKRPSIDDFDLESSMGSQSKLLRDDEKIDSLDSNGFVQIQTLATYKIYDGARLVLSLKPGTNCTNTSSFSSIKSSQGNSVGVSNGLPSSYATHTSSSTKTTDTDQHWHALQGTENQILLNSPVEMLNTRKEHRPVHTEPSFLHSRAEHSTRCYHLVKPTDREDDDRTVVTNKLVSEVYLTRLLATKGSLQHYIDNFFDTVFCLADLPSPIKYLFDFLDEQAEYYQISDPNILHTWKSNSLPLRFFVNIIKNPDFIFDIQKTNVIDASLSVIAQMFMDSCAAGTHQLTKDSPSSKLLFYRDVQKYKKLVEKYYDSISLLPGVPTSELDRSVNLIREQEQQNLPNKRPNEFNRTYALFKLYNEFISRHKHSLQVAIANDPLGKQYRLAALFEQIVTSMDSFDLDI